MHPLMRRMACSLMLNAACTAAPCFAHPPAARADTLPAPREEKSAARLIHLHYEQTALLAQNAHGPAPRADAQTARLPATASSHTPTPATDTHVPE
jgi:hypothetical protein